MSAWSTSTNAPSWEITQPDVDALRQPLIDLWQRNLPTAAKHRFEWLYGSGRAQGWLLGEPASPASGAAGLMLRTIAIGGRPTDCGATIDLNVNESLRSGGPALALARAVTNAADREGRELLFGMPNRSAAAVLKRAGYRELGAFSDWTKVLRTEPNLQRVLRSRFASRLLAPVADKALHLISFDWYAPVSKDWIAEPLSQFDGRFDRLSSRAASQFDVVGERTEDFLTWRFTKCPDLDYHIFTVAERATGELSGYVVWYENKGAISISDLLAIDGPATSLLLTEFSRHCRQSNSMAIRFGCLASAEFYHLLKRAGFHRRRNRHPVLARWSNRSDSKVREGANWYLTMADSDTDV